MLSFKASRHWRASLRYVSCLCISILLTFSFLSFIAPSTQAITAADTTITVNKAIQYQRIEGFGGFGADASYNDRLINDLGITIDRDVVTPAFEQTPGVFDINAEPQDVCQGQTSSLATHGPPLKDLQARANAAGQPLKIFASVWSPPAWMKYVTCIFGTDNNWNRLIVNEILSGETPNDRKADFADYLVKYVQAFKSVTGIDLYALSLQNEPAFGEPYPSAVYSPEVLKEVVKVVGQAFEQNGITTKLIIPEDVSDVARISSFIQWAETDPLARKYVSIFAVHGFIGATNEDVAGPANQAYWTQLHTLAAQYNLPLWMTETSGYNNNWSGGLYLAGSIYTALKYGQLNAWVWWLFDYNVDSNQGLMLNGVPTTGYYTSKQFSRYIPAGSVIVDANSPDPDILVTAASHVASKTTTLVLINKNSTAAKSVKLNITGGNVPAQFNVIRSSATENAVALGSVGSADSITLPASSVTTLTGISSAQDALLAPSILTQPQNVSVQAGQQVTFQVQATGTPDLKYQWYRNGTPITGATGSIYAFSAASGDDNAQYSVQVTNDQGTVTSSAATLSVGAFTGAIIPSTTTPITIDGNLSDTVWSTATSYTLSHTTGSPANISASFQAAWDNTNLYLAGKVNDSSYATGSDQFEVYLDGNNTKYSTYGPADLQYLFTWGSTAVNQYAGGAQGTKTQGVQFAQVANATSDGYQIEAKIPWSTLGITPADGSIIGLDIDVGQQSTPGTTKGKLFWNATSDDDWHDPSRFGVAKLSNSGSDSTTWTLCVDEGGTCTFSGTHQVRYGANGIYNYQTATGSISCSNGVFGDPTPGVFKSCYYS